MVEVEFKFWPPDYCADKPYIILSLKKVSKEGLRGLKICVWSQAASLDLLEHGCKESDWGFRKMPEQEFRARSQAAVLLSE